MAEAGPLERHAEDTRPVNSLSYLPMSKLTKERWSADDTERFYQAVATVGLDFSMIAKFFQGRTRKQVRACIHTLLFYLASTGAVAAQRDCGVFLHMRSDLTWLCHQHDDIARTLDDGLPLATDSVTLTSPCQVVSCDPVTTHDNACSHEKSDGGPEQVVKLQVKNKYLKESKVNGRRMTLAMSGKLKDVDSLRESAAFLKRDADAGGDAGAAGTESGAAGAASGSQAGAAASSGAGASGAVAGEGKAPRAERKTAAIARAPVEDDEDEDDALGEAVNPSLANYFY